MQPESCIQALRDAFPDLPVQDVQVDDRGQYNLILLVNHILIFRFPRHAPDLARMEKEVLLLQRLQGRLPLQIPNPLYSYFSPQGVGHSFMGYALLPGEPLWYEKFSRLPPEALPRLAEQLAGFLQALHSLPLDEVAHGFPVQDGAADWQVFYDRIRYHLFPLMSATGRSKAQTHFEPFLAQPANYAFQPALRHGDFGTGNILYEKRRRAASAVIDWDSAGVGDPAVDLAAVSCFGQPFFDLFQVYYPVSEQAQWRARFYKGTFALQEALHGFETGDEQAFKSGMAGYRA